jgi:hypothetical protein
MVIVQTNNSNIILTKTISGSCLNSKSMQISLEIIEICLLTVPIIVDAEFCPSIPVPKKNLQLNLIHDLIDRKGQRHQMQFPKQ